MRVISGSARGIKLEALEGLSTRPTTDRVKEATFSMIQMKIYGSTSLDLFSGSGALGIELLSRGAETVTLVEEQSKARDIIMKNLKKTNLTEKANVVGEDVYRFLSRYQGEPFDLILMDPPYLKGHIKQCLEMIEDRNLLSEGGLVVVEHDISDPDVLMERNQIVSLKSKKYGKIGVTVFGRSS